MTKVITCPCGYVVRAKDEKEIVASAQRHAKEAHGMELTREQILAMARPE
jgi:predicted small metal-binding protein